MFGSDAQTLLKASSEANNSYWTESHTEKIWDSFLRVQLTKFSIFQKEVETVH